MSEQENAEKAKKILGAISLVKAKKEAAEQLKLGMYETLTTKPERFTKPRTLVLQGDGIWLVERSRLGQITTHSVIIDLPGLPKEMEEGFEFFLPKIPHNLLAQVISFFRKICDSMKEAEAYAVIYYDTKEERYFVDVPEHEVSKGGVKYTRTLQYEADPRYITAMELHSHNTMHGSFSSIDDRDEKAFHLYGVIGSIHKAMPSYELRTVCSANGKEVTLALDDIFTLTPEEVKVLTHIPIVKFPETEWVPKVKAISEAKLVMRHIVSQPTRSSSFAGFDPRRFGFSYGEQLELLPRPSERLSKLEERFGKDVLAAWAELGLDREDKQRIYSLGEDPEEIEELLAEREGFDPSELDDPFEWVEAEEDQFFGYVDTVSTMLNSETATNLIGRLLANGFATECIRAMKEFKEDPDAFGKPIWDEDEDAATDLA